MTSYRACIVSHYEVAWLASGVARRWERGPIGDLPREFCVLEFPPRPARAAWTYATCCMSRSTDPAPLELHLLSPVSNSSLVELLTAIAHYHRTGLSLHVGDSVNFGRPWLDGSHCDFGLISRPYLDGPALEYANCPPAAHPVRFLWLIPITMEEVSYKRQQGVDALERRFQSSGFNYLDPTRPSVA